VLAWADPFGNPGNVPRSIVGGSGYYYNGVAVWCVAWHAQPTPMQHRTVLYMYCASIPTAMHARRAWSTPMGSIASPQARWPAATGC
jgi:hypothetical protein